MHILSQTAYAILSMPCLMLTLGAPPTRRAWAKDLTGRYVWANAHFAADLGLDSPATLCGRSTDEIWPQCWREIARVDRHVLDQRAEVVGHSEELEFADGTVLVAVTRVPLVDECGDVCGIAGYYDAAPHGELARRHERQLMLLELSPESRARIADGMAAFAEEMSA